MAWPYCLVRQQTLPWLESSLLIGALAFLLAMLTKQRWWWRLIHALFAPAVALSSEASIPPQWYLLAFALTFLIYRGALSNQVPLYLSSRATICALTEILGNEPKDRFIDLGAGIGTVTSGLAVELNDTRVDGIENSIMPWLIGCLRTRRLKNCRFLLGSLWKISLADYDAAYAFLSPVPMADLWIKVKREMRPGSLLISNSFAVPDVEASFVVDVADARGTRLYCYRV